MTLHYNSEGYSPEICDLGLFQERCHGGGDSWLPPYCFGRMSVERRRGESTVRSDGCGGGVVAGDVVKGWPTVSRWHAEVPAPVVNGGRLLACLHPRVERRAVRRGAAPDRGPAWPRPQRRPATKRSQARPATAPDRMGARAPATAR